MAPERSKMMRQLSGDIISNLPRDVMDNILKRLPLREAGRTSSLSQSWRYMWANLPYLVFDHNTFTGTTQKTQDQLLIAIQEILLLKRVPIVEFDLSLPGLKSCRQIDTFVSFLSWSRGLKELSIYLAGGELYKLPPSLFSCLGLTHLTLGYCVIKPPNQFKGFNRLASLEIHDCSILPDVLSGLISSCPLLEELMVTSDSALGENIQISAPNLRELIFAGGFTSISFIYTPCLSRCVLELTYGVNLRGERSNDVQSFCKLVAIEDLRIQLDCLPGHRVSYNSLPRKLTTSLNHLKSLTLTFISHDILYEVSTLLCLIRSSTNLTEIVVLEFSKVQPGETDLEQITQLLEVQEWSEISLNSLREVEVHQITGEAWEVGFIKLLLAISPKLETVIVRPHESVELRGRSEILTKLTGLRRVSPLAEIIYEY